MPLSVRLFIETIQRFLLPVRDLEAAHRPGRDLGALCLSLGKIGGDLLLHDPNGHRTEQNLAKALPDVLPMAGFLCLVTNAKLTQVNS